MRGDSASFPKVSVVVFIPSELPYPVAALKESVASAINQDYKRVEILLLADGKAPLDLATLPITKSNDLLLRNLTGDYRNRAAMGNAALRAATGEWLLFLSSEQYPVMLKRSAVTAMVMAARRHPNAGMVSGDYQRVSSDGRVCDIHLPIHHAGRLRDTTDYGPAILYNAEALRRVGGFDERFDRADRYDLRLKISERYRIVQIANRTAGALAAVHVDPAAHNVFDYLLASKDAQREMEQALTEHLKRIGAYLASGDAFQSVSPMEGSYDFTASVIIPVHRRPEFIAGAIESVQAQTAAGVEAVVVVNGGHDDPTLLEVQRFLPGGDRYDSAKPPVKLVVLDINNIGLSLNAGVEAARGRYYVQLDSDDRLKPNAVERIVAVFESDPTVGMVIGSYEVWDLDVSTGRRIPNTRIPVVTHEEWTVDNGRNNLLRVNGAGAPRAVPIHLLKQLGGFGMNDSPHSRNYGEDYELVLRISERHTIGRVWEPIYEVLRHPGGTDHAIDPATVARNDDAKDQMRYEAVLRRQELNRARTGRNQVRD